MFNTILMNFIKNEYIKLDETSLDVQVQFKACLSNGMDVLGSLPLKIHETLKTSYI